MDDVRFLANGSSGRMGYALAAAARAVGVDVVLVTGPVALPPPEGVRVVPVVSALEMLAAVEAEFPLCEGAFFVAAVSDYRPARRLPGKPPKLAAGADRPLSVDLLPNPDIAATMGQRKGARWTVGFALEAGPLDEALERGRQKLAAKNLDWIAVNLVAAMDAERSRVILLHRDGSRRDLPEQTKAQTARDLVAAVVPTLRQPPSHRSATDTGDHDQEG